ncbi:hypothetical protein ACFFQF_32035 [Haladaptatus pallidirubidus]|uniref:hypothetical protein n=1 Tax=Haladaptatus pallidirubidus TaxID=1008152 RepID=UPI0031EA1176
MSAHVVASDLEERLSEVTEAYRFVAVDEAVVPHLPTEDFESAEAIKETATRLVALSTALDDPIGIFTTTITNTSSSNSPMVLQDSKRSSNRPTLVSNWTSAGCTTPAEILSNSSRRTEIGCP